jgi:hypothetical protein
VLQCGEDSEYGRQKYGGYFTVFCALLEEDSERWRVYSAIRGELHADAEAAGFESTGGGDGGCEVRRLVSCQPARGRTGALLLLLASCDKGTTGGGLAMW